MNILYMGYFCREQLFNRLVENGSQSSHARQQLETKLLNGLITEKGENSLEIISYLPELSEVREMAGEGEVYQGVKVKYLWCNKKHPFSVFKAMIRNGKMIREWAKNKTEKVVVTYSVNPIHVIPLLWFRKRYNYKIISLCPEVSVFRRTDNISFATRVSRKISSFLDNSFDGYIMLSPYMNEVVNLKCRPFIVMEGIADSVDDAGMSKSERAILYAGGLTADNGIEILLEGFVKAECSDTKLWICGDGPLQAKVKDYADKYENICYWGIVPNEKVQQLERQAMLLISPRFSHNEFTKYSFPSKTIEYMSTGTPTALTKLGGIPEEYFEYVYVLEEETEQGVEKLIKYVVSQSEDARKQLGNAAKEFVFRNKNSSVQARRIINFMSDFI